MRYKVAILTFAALIFLTPFVTNAQGITQVVAGPNGSQFRAVVTFVPQVPEDTWKMQSLILDTELVKRGAQPSWFMVDLTSTTRNLDTDVKKQKFLLIRWTPNAGIEAQCTQGWVKATGSDVDKIVAVTRSLYQTLPIETRQPVQLQLPKDVEQNISGILNGLETSKMQCIQDGSTN